MMGSVVLGGLCGLLASVVALFLGAGYLSAFAVYVVTGFITMTCVTLVLVFKEDADGGDSMIATPAPAENTMAQWMQDSETRLEDDDDDQDKPKVA